VATESLNLRIPRSAKVGIIGASGLGKSTVLSLILRLCDPTYGSVAIDGCDLRDVTRRSLGEQIGVVFQESFLFNSSIRENIRHGKPGANDAEVEAAARAAEIHDYIQNLPQGCDRMRASAAG